MSMVTTKSSQQHKKGQDEDSVNVSPASLMYVDVILTVAMVHIVALMSPGPDFFLSLRPLLVVPVKKR